MEIPWLLVVRDLFSRQYSEFLTSHENFVTVDTDYFMGKIFLDPYLLCGLLLTKFNVSVLLLRGGGGGFT